MANKKHTTPAGTAIWPYLNKADTKYNANGEFKVSLRYLADDVQELIEFLDNAAEAAYKAETEKLEELINSEDTPKPKKGKVRAALKKVQSLGPHAPYTMVLDDETGEENGEVDISLKMINNVTVKSTGKSFSQKPVIFDAKGKVLKNPPMINGGSTLKASYELTSFCMPASVGAGVSLRLKAVQIIDLAEYGSDPDAYGFGAEEGGYEADEDAYKAAAASDRDDDTSDDDADDDYDF